MIQNLEPMTGLLHHFTLEALPGTFTEFEAPAGELGHFPSVNELVAQQDFFPFVDVYAVNTDHESFTHHTK